MKRLNIIVEGHTEEAFVKELLSSHFAKTGIYISTRKVQTGWNKLHNKPSKGGLVNYSKFKNDINRWIHSEQNQENTWYSCMVDLYAFPKDKSSPYTSDIQKIQDFYLRVRALEDAIAEDINHPRFIPHIQLHEFESLLLVEPEKLIMMFPDREAAIRNLKESIKNFNPEEINESSQNAPSKRIIKHIPEYHELKSIAGPLVAHEIGLNKLRKSCPHFNDWISKLEEI